MKSSSRAVVLCAVLGALVTPACEIRIRQEETSGQAPPDPTSGAGGTGDPTSTLTPEELAAIDALQKADPVEIALVTDTAAFAAVTTNNLISAQMADLSTLDATTAAQLIDSVAPDAINAALAWSQSIDPSTLPTGIYPKEECTNPPHDCAYTMRCPNVPGICTVTQCGEGSCPMCPGFSENVLIKGWCAYGCMKGTEVTGGGFILQTRFALPIPPICFEK